MQPVFIAVLLGLAAAAWAQEQPIFVPKTWLKTVKELDRSKYVGRWFQTYGNAFGYATHGNTVCNTADYKAYNETIISVRNHGHFEQPDGEVTEIRGMAISTEAPGKFRLRLGNVAFEGSYWVLQLGPVIDGLYDYAVISSENGLALYVMTRDIDRFPDYEQDILDYLKEQRFTDQLTTPIVMYQGADCRYIPEENPIPELY